MFGNMHTYRLQVCLVHGMKMYIGKHNSLIHSLNSKERQKPPFALSLQRKLMVNSVIPCIVWYVSENVTDFLSTNCQLDTENLYGKSLIYKPPTKVLTTITYIPPSKFLASISLERIECEMNYKLIFTHIPLRGNVCSSLGF